LRGDPGSGVGFGEPPVYQAGDPHIVWSIDHDHQVIRTLQAQFRQERYIVDDHCIVGQGSHQLRGSRRDPWMCDRVQPRSCRLVGEHDLSHRSAVETTVGGTDSRAEFSDQGTQPVTARRDDFAGDPVGVDHIRTEFREQLRHG